MKRLLAVLVLLVANVAWGDEIEECGTYEMSGLVKVQDGELALVLERGTRSETVILLGDYEKKKHEDLVGTLATGSVEIINFCKFTCMGEVDGELRQLEPDTELEQFFFPKPQPQNAFACADDAPMPDARKLEGAD